MTAAAGDPPDKDQSMDDILASIRRIMLDEQARLQDGPGALAYAAGRAPEVSTDPVLILDASMVVEDRSAEHFIVPVAEETVIMVSSERTEMPLGPPDPVEVERVAYVSEAMVPRAVPADAATADAAVPVARETEHSAQMTVLGATADVAHLEPYDGRPQIVMSAQAIEDLMAPAAAAAAAASVESLLRRLSEERLAAIPPSPPSSPTIEAVVREELRPFLKVWLDQHLPSMVERLVRAEITRLIERSGL
jgi:cell pole-organizing protein PopZ